MGIFRQFPYSNFHDMNMDEIIKIVKNMLEEWAQYYDTWDNWKEQVTQEWSEMQSFINNYFDNLDVQNEINNKITSMVNSGEFGQIVDPYVPPAVSAWLADHITTPETVVIDDSLSIRGAVADAYAAGRVENTLNSAIKEQTRNLLNNVSFEKGSLNGGAETSAATRIRSKYIDISDVTNLKITITNGYKYTLNFYSDTYTWIGYTMGGFYSGLFDWQTADRTIPIIPPKLKYMRVLIADTSDSSSIAITDVDKISIKADYSLLHSQNIQNNAINLLNDWIDGVSNVINHDIWVNGVALGGLSNWEINNSTTRIWSGIIDVPKLSVKLKLTTANGYKCAYYLFDSTWTKVAENYWATSYEVTIPSTARYIIVSIATTDDNDITPAAGANITISFEATTDFPVIPDHIQFIENITDISNIDLGWQLGTLVPNTGAELASTTRIRSGFILVGADTELVLTDTDYRHLYYKYDLTKAYQSDSSWTTQKITIDEECYIRILMCKDGNETITPEEVDTIAETESIYRAFPQSIVDGANDNTIPSYFLTDINNAIDDARTNLFNTGIDGDSFIFITDVHWQSNEKYSPALVKQIIDNTNVDKIICGGDLIGGGAKASMIKLMSNCVDSFKSIGRFYSLLGNHDTNKLGSDSAVDYFTKANAYALMQKESDFIMDYGDPCYFYFDNPTTKTRYICLDTGEESTGLDETQSSWLSSTLASMPSGYHALVFAHIIYQPTDTWHIGLQPSELEMTQFMTDVCDILDEFNTNNADKVVEAIFGGHTHIDANFTTTGGIPIVVTDCDARQTFTETSPGSGIANHAAGTINEQCFDIITIDYTNETIKCVRVGRGSDRTITY